MPDERTRQVLHAHRANHTRLPSSPFEHLRFWLNSGLRPETRTLINRIIMSFNRAKEPKTTRLPGCRVTEAEKKQIENRAEDCGLSVSDYLVRSALRRQTRTKHDVHVINELRAINDTLRGIYHGAVGRKPEELQRLLESVVRAINRIGENGFES